MNKSLQALNLKSNNLKLGVHKFTQAIKGRNTTCSIELSDNNLEDSEAQAISEIVKTNPPRAIGLNNNKITNDGANILAARSEKSDKTTRIKLETSKNSTIDPEIAYKLMEGNEKNGRN